MQQDALILQLFVFLESATLWCGLPASDRGHRHRPLRLQRGKQPCTSTCAARKVFSVCPCSRRSCTSRSVVSRSAFRMITTGTMNSCTNREVRILRGGEGSIRVGREGPSCRVWEVREIVLHWGRGQVVWEGSFHKSWNKGRGWGKPVGNLHGECNRVTVAFRREGATCAEHERGDSEPKDGKMTICELKEEVVPAWTEMKSVFICWGISPREDVKAVSSRIQLPRSRFYVLKVS